MDFHDLQRKLFELDPSDPREDLRKLQAAASAPVVVENTRDYVVESREITKGSLPLNLDSIADFAALAGVRIDEKALLAQPYSADTRKADQAHGSDPMPKMSKPSGKGTQPHPLRGKLVGGESIENEAGIAQGYQSAKAGTSFMSPNAAQNAIQSKIGGRVSQPEKVSGGVTAQQLNALINVKDPVSFAQGIQKAKMGQALSLTQQKSLSDAFVKLMAMDPAQTQKVMVLLKRMESSQQAGQPKSAPRQATATPGKAESIKERLYKALRDKTA